jgi:hypothetical protein
MEKHGTDATIGIASRRGLAFHNYVPIGHWSHSGIAVWLYHQAVRLVAYLLSGSNYLFS